MNFAECIKSLEVILGCVYDKLQGERDKITKIDDIKPSSFEFVITETIARLEEAEGK